MKILHWIPNIIASPDKRYSRGVALIIVVVTTAMLGMMLVVSVPLAQVCADSVVAQNERLLNFYLAESTISRAQMCLMNDIVGFKNRSILSSLISENAGNEFRKDANGEEVTRFVADRTEHKIDFEYSSNKKANCTFQFEDAVSNFNFTGTSKQLDYRFSEYIKAYAEDQEKYDKMEKIYNQILDYADEDEDPRDESYESTDYYSFNLPNLPRNSAIETVEELLLIPGVRGEIVSVNQDGLLENVRVGLTPKLKVKFATLENSSGSGSFASAGSDYISSRVNSSITNTELRDRLAEAIQAYQTDGTALYSNLDEDELSQLKNSFSDDESGLYTLTAVGGTQSQRSQRRIKLSFPCQSRFSTDENLCYMLHRFYYITY